MAIARDEADEIPDHVERQVAAAALLKTEHGEVGVPIVDLVEAPARHDIVVRQRRSDERGSALSGSRASTDQRESMWLQTSWPGIDR